MEISGTLIKKFFDRNCTAEEAELVADHLYSNPELLDKYFEADDKEFVADYLSKKETDVLLKNIKQQTVNNIVRIKAIKKLIAVAASVLFIIGFYQFFLSSKTSNNSHLSQPAISDIKPWKFRINNTSEIISSSLEDGTSMRLQPHSFIKYQSFVAQNKRDVYLNGEVFFKVAKDKTKPFTVYAGNLTTTALGTQFSVQDNKQKITIKLFEGKVVIKTVVPIKQWKNDVYLISGQQLVFDKINSSFIVKAIGDTNHLIKNTVSKKNDIKLSSTTKSGNWYMFNNQSLRNVFDQLGEIYNIKIDYKNIDIKNVYFIGRFEKTDSVEAILNNIALLKKLHIDHRNNTYIITKK